MYDFQPKKNIGIHFGDKFKRKSPYITKKKRSKIQKMTPGERLI